MAYRNIKVDFEYKGTTYTGIALQDGVVMRVSPTEVDGIPAFVTFTGCAADHPMFNPDGIASISRNSLATAGYYALMAT